MHGASSTAPLSADRGDDIRERRAADFARIALPLLPSIARLARALSHDANDADDLVQETFLRAWKHWHTYAVESDCRPWLATICRNIYRQQCVRGRWVTAAGDELESETFAAVRLHIAARESGVEDIFSRVDIGPAIAAAIAALDRPFREVVQLADLDGLTYEEIADRLALPIGTVRSRLYRARRRLQTALVAFAVDAGFPSVAVDPSSAESPRTSPA
ncbi:MAG: RNA polymerase sigma factor SigR [Gemmatimonadaceae bacterium]